MQDDVFSLTPRTHEKEGYMYILNQIYTTKTMTAVMGTAIEMVTIEAVE